MHFLMTYDLSEFNVRQCPKTDELRAQQSRTLSGTLPGFIKQVLNDGQLMPGHRGWREVVLQDEFVDAAQEYIGNTNTKKDDVNAWLVGFFEMPMRDLLHRKKGKHFLWKNSRGVEKTSFERFYNFRSLAACRTLWDQKFGPEPWAEVDHSEDPDNYENIEESTF